MKNLCCTLFILGLVIGVFAQAPMKVNFGLGKVHLAKFSPGNDHIAFAMGNKVKLFRSGIEIAAFSNHNSRINDFAFDPEGLSIMACHTNGYVTIWNTKTRTITHDFKIGNTSLLACKFLESLQKVALISTKALVICNINGEIVIEIPVNSGTLRALAVSKQGRTIAMAGSTGHIAILDGLGNRIREFDTQQNWILSLALSPNGKTLASGDSDGTIKLWNVETGVLTETLLKTSGRINSLEFSSDGKYLAAGAESFFVLSVSNEQPDVVYRKLNGAALSSSFSPNGKQICVVEDWVPYATLYDISDLHIPPVFHFKDERDLIAPQIYISNPARIINDRVNCGKDLIDLQGSIFDDYGVRNLKINGIETPIHENGKFIIHIPLTMGENLITLEASDINGNTTLKRFIINRKGYESEYDPLVARNFLFIVGINDYQYWPTLNNAVKDGIDLADVLMRDYHFEFRNITILKDEQATRNNIYQGLRSLIEQITPQDNLLVYFSGHGHFDDLLQEGYWIPVDSHAKAEVDYLSNSSILRILENINSQHTLLIADACFSGSLFIDSHRGDGGYIENVEKIRSRWGLASGRLEVVSDGEIGANSPFARVLISYLAENPKSEFTVSELIQHVKMKVAEESDQTPIGNPLRLSGEAGGEFVFRKTKQLVVPLVQN